MLEILERDGPIEARDVARILGVTPDRVKQIIKEANKATGNAFAHIAEWRRNYGTSGKPSPLFAAGPGRNRPRPKPEPPNVKRRRYDRNKRALRRIASRRRKGANNNPFATMIQQLTNNGKRKNEPD